MVDETPEISRSKDEFKYCDTPTLFVVRADHLLHCPVWFDEIEPTPTGSLYNQIELPLEHRTPELKIFHATQAIMSNQFKRMVFDLLIAHVVSVPNSYIRILDGYPHMILQGIKTAFEDGMKAVFGEKFTKGVVNIYGATTFNKYLNAVSELKAQAENDKIAFVQIDIQQFNYFIPAIDEYNKALQDTHLRQKQAQAEKAPVAQAFKPYLIGGANDPDTNGGGTILQ